MNKVTIIDDEPLARDILKEYLQDIPGFEVVSECGDGFEGLKAIARDRPDLVFLDVQMPKISGFEMLELLEEPPAVIFTTAFDEYAIRAFEASAVDYLLKPFAPERLEKALQKYLQQGPSKAGVPALLETASRDMPQQRIVVRLNNTIKIIPLQQVQYLEAADDYVKVYTPEGSFLKNKTMQYFEKSLPAGQFVRVHRSYILNISQITRIDPYEKEGHIAVLKSAAHIPVSKTGYQKLKVVLGL